jgi:hypothetical protein
MTRNSQGLDFAGHRIIPADEVHPVESKRRAMFDLVLENSLAVLFAILAERQYNDFGEYQTLGLRLDHYRMAIV